MLENKKITVNTKSEVNNINIKPFEDKLNINNTVLNASLINLSGLIQKILEENKKITKKTILMKIIQVMEIF